MDSIKRKKERLCRSFEAVDKEVDYPENHAENHMENTKNRNSGSIQYVVRYGQKTV